MDNKHIDISSEGMDDFRLAIRLAFNCAQKCVGYSVHDGTMVLYHCDDKKNMTAFPYAFDVEQTINFVWGWLMVNMASIPEPDHDGDNGRGFRVYTNEWGQGLCGWQSFANVIPIWAMYGK